MENKYSESDNQRLIEEYIAKMRNKAYMHTEDSYPDSKKYRIGYETKWIGRKKYRPFYRRDIMEYANSDIRMSKVRKLDLINFNIIDMKFERMMTEHCCMMNGTFRNVRFFRFCISGRPFYPDGSNEYHDGRSIVMNCRFENCVFMNSYAEHTDWINCEFINCTFINSELCCDGSEYQNCRSENSINIYFRA